MERAAIKRGQIWQNRWNKSQYQVFGKKRGKWLTKVLTNRTDVYSATHTMDSRTLWSKFDLIK